MAPLQLNSRSTALEALQQKKHWVFRDRGPHGMIREPQWKEGMWFFPMDERQAASLHPEAIRRILTVAELVPIKGVVVGHEFPKLLPPPADWKAPEPTKFDWEPVAKAAATVAVVGAVGVAAVVAISVAATIAVLAAAAAAPAVVVVGGTAGAVYLDPVACVVLEDGTWLDVFSYEEPSGAFSPASATERRGLPAPVSQRS